MKQETNDLIERLKKYVKYAEENNMDMNSRSWEMEEGLLISVNEAKDIVESLTNPEILASENLVKQEWYYPSEGEFPICYQSGRWDGLKSDPVLTKDKDGNPSLLFLIEGEMDGSKFKDWYGIDEFNASTPYKWQKIPE